MTADPKTLLAAPLHRANVPNAELLAGEQLALLRGNHLLADDPPSRRKPAAREVRRDCPHHPGTETPGGLCPTCGYRTEG